MDAKIKAVCTNELNGRESVTEAMRRELLKESLKVRSKQKRMWSCKAAKRFKASHPDAVMSVCLTT